MVKKLIILAAFMAAGVAVYFLFFNKSEEDIIRDRLYELAKCASKTAGEGAAATLLKHRGLTGLFDDPCTIFVKEATMNGSYKPMELAAQAARARQMAAHMNFSFSDINIRLAPNREKADIEFSARAQIQLKDGKEADEVRELKGIAVKTEGKWKFSNFEVRQVLEK